MRKLKLLLTCLFAVASISLVSAQTKTASGTVVSAEDGLPVIGASVVVKGTAQGTLTNTDGWFSLSVPTSNDMLVISMIGMKPMEVRVGENLSVIMVVDDSELDEVVVIGYTSVKKSSLTGAVGTVSNKEIKDVPIANAGQALQGKSTGMQVVASTGRPGAAPNVKVRGIGSINAGTNPLFVIDGVPMSAADFSILNANDIESVSVLKDASATSIYGSRGANGVVIVTTKRGESGKNSITAKAQWGITNKTSDRFTMMNAVEKLTYEKQLGVGLGVTLTDDEIQNYETNTNWGNEVLRTGLTEIYDLAVRGGNGGTRYLVSGQYYDQEALVYGSDYTKLSGRINLEQEILKNLKFDIRIGTGKTTESILRTSRNALNPLNYIYDANPYVAPFNDDGSYNTSNRLPNQLNIFEQIDNNPQQSNISRTIGAASLEWEVIKGLKLKTTEGINTLTAYQYYYVKPESGLSQLLGSPYGYRTDTYNNGVTLLSTNQATYEHLFADTHDLKLLAATEISKYDYRAFTAAMSGFPTGKIDAIGKGTVADNATGNEEAWRMLSYFGSANYIYDEKYYVDLSLRHDGSSRFGENKKYGTFWSAGAAWNIKNESFLKDSQYIDALKLRVSTGVTGNNVIGNYAAQGVFGYGSYNGAVTSYPSRLPNKELTWERNYQTSVGADLSVLRNRINFTVDLYDKTSKDMLLSRPLSMTSGFSSRLENVGEMQNRGIELSLDGYPIKTRDMSLKLYANTSLNKNKVLKLYAGEDIEIGWNNIISEGLPIFNYKMVRWAGVNPANGNAMYYDKDGKITETYDGGDAVVLDGLTPLPKAYGSFGATYAYKGFDLTADFYYSWGNYIYNHISFFTLSDGSGAAGSNKDVRLLKEQWQKPGDITNIPKQSTSNSSQMSTRFLEDASYLRLRNLTAAYTLPKKVLEKVKLETLRVFITGNNLFTFTGFNGLDPEVSDNPVGSGVGSEGSVLDFSYPAARTIMFGFEIGL